MNGGAVESHKRRAGADLLVTRLKLFGTWVLPGARERYERLQPDRIRRIAGILPTT